MSDYLGNLIARTLSPEAVVRPQMPALFEPAPLGPQSKSGFDLEQETFSEPPQTTPQRKMSEPVPLTIPPIRQSVLSEPVASIPQVKRTVRANEQAGSSREGVVRDATPLPESRPFPKRPEPGNEPFSPPPHKIGFLDNKLEMDFPRRRSEDADTSETRPANFKAQPKNKHPSLSATAKVTPVVKPVAPPVRVLPPKSSPPIPAAPHTINVTIGRVEIRAASPPVPQRAKAKSANVLSLEDYLRQRANGGGR